MAANSLPPSDENTPDYDPQLDAEDEALSSGNTRLGLIVGGLFLAGVLTFALVPKEKGGALASVTPSFMLDDAAVTATTAEPVAPAAAAPVAPATAEPVKPKPTTATAIAPAAARPTAATAATATAAEPAAAAPVEAPAPEAEPARPTTVTVTGRILDEEGKPLAGATVLLKGSGKGTGTDANGNYTMEVPTGDNVLSIGYGGYQDEEIHARGSQPVNVTLTPTPGAKRRRK
jgi:hypothetical protein